MSGVRIPVFNSKGQAAIEFLLILPLFIFFLLLLLDFGLFMYQWVSVTNAVREGARFGAVNCRTGRCDPNTIAQVVVNRSGGVIQSVAEVSVGWVDNNGNGRNYDRGDSVVVRARHPYSFLFVPGVTWDAYSCADMRLEQMDDNTALPAGRPCTEG
jgi:Flp pilus assembly protein TadG